MPITAVAFNGVNSNHLIYKMIIRSIIAGLIQLIVTTNMSIVNKSITKRLNDEKLIT